MRNDTEAAVQALNDLIATCHDSEEGYAKAAKGVRDNELSDRLASISGQRGRFADELSALVSNSGGQPATDAHFGGILHPGWVDLETRLRGKDDDEILDECRLGDDATVKHYQHALTQPLPEQARAVVERQLNTIQGEVDSLSEPKHPSTYV
jgi:uncharacterized protein (TIGR02284 family)